MHFKLLRQYKKDKTLFIFLVFGVLAGFVLFSVKNRMCMTNSLLKLYSYFDGENVNVLSKYDNPTSKNTISGDVNKPKLYKELFIVGIMTTRKNMKTRAQAIHDTWSKELHGKLLFFIGSGRQYDGSLPVVVLADVKETYPPQKKVFRMLQYFHNHFIDKYHFFLRADDDMYASVATLTLFLASLNASVAHYIGQTGRGIITERTKLNLKQPYCKGGPGVVLSHEALRLLYPSIDECIYNVSSKHEDTELGRCIEMHLGIPCAKPESLQREFYERYGRRMKTNVGSLKHAITVHAQKKPEDMYRLHHFMLRNRLQQLHTAIALYSREIHSLNARIETYIR